jgi:hypothetical protein
MSGRHKWKQDQTWGVTAGSGRPHGVIETWTCCRCGAQKKRAPRSTHTGARVLRWTYRGPYGETVERMGSCLGYLPATGND